LATPLVAGQPVASPVRDRGPVCRPTAVGRSDGAARRPLGEFAHRFLI
jgi:hypothetical protein